ncbi:glycerate kinase type-2 family protein [Microbulbifer celer]|uniref:Glycerate kinase n=1 Tax=Microbulbifer celer TaxID=435905 RepID=A0ABW3U6K6_9GAMM|nr:glycerate kinase [Microbulbifer celer]UFN57744.1 glycerate kinase [Microbulbifer celer]
MKRSSPMNKLPKLETLNRPADYSAWLRGLSEIAVSSVHPETLLPSRLPEPPTGRTIVIGAGKAAAAMAAALEKAWAKKYMRADIQGLVVTRYDHGAPCKKIEVLEASHPMPDNMGEVAAKRMLSAVKGLGKNDLVIALISGGGSALMTLPAPGLKLEQKQAINKALLRCGAPIREINTVRRHLSAIKGGRLAAAAHPARVVTYLISDVPGDDPTLIASGPTLPDTSTPADALEILQRYKIEIDDAVRDHLQGDTKAPKFGDRAFNRDTARVLAKASDALDAASDASIKAGVDVRVLGDNLEGEARDLGQAHARLALQAQREITHPLVILSGGETSVTVKGNGRGGRNVEYLLGLFTALAGAVGIYGLAIDTDGIDGSEDNAGALFTPDDWAKMQAQGLNPREYLANNDAYSFFAELENLIVTGPTRTNVNDFRAILILPAV